MRDCVSSSSEVCSLPVDSVRQRERNTHMVDCNASWNASINPAGEYSAHIEAPQRPVELRAWYMGR